MDGNYEKKLRAHSASWGTYFKTLQRLSILLWSTLRPNCPTCNFCLFVNTTISDCKSRHNYYHLEQPALPEFTMNSAACPSTCL